MTCKARRTAPLWDSLCLRDAREREERRKYKGDIKHKLFKRRPEDKK